MSLGFVKSMIFLLVPDPSRSLLSRVTAVDPLVLRVADSQAYVTCSFQVERKPDHESRVDNNYLFSREYRPEEHYL
jgi:hypothetical protein